MWFTSGFEVCRYVYALLAGLDILDTRLIKLGT